MNVEAGFQLSDINGIARRRLKVALAIALVVSLAAYWIAMALPNEYASYATVLVEPQAVDPDLVEAGVGETDLNRRLHLMAAQILSRPRLSRIIDELGLYSEESNYLVRDEIINLMREQISVEPVIPEMEREQNRGREIQIDQFRIHFSDDRPGVARDVAQRLANDFIKEHIESRVKTSQKSLEFIEAEQVRLAGAIQEVEKRIQEVKSGNSGRLPEDFGANQRRLERVTAQIADARREAAVARSDEAFFRSQSVTARELVGSSTREANTPQQRIQSLELALAEFTARGLTEKHPDMLKVKRELATLQAQVDADGAEGSPNSFAEQSADAEAARARLRMVSSEQEIARLEASYEALQVLLGEAPAVAEQLDGLEREHRHLFESYQDFSNRRLEAGVQADLERRQLGEQFRVLEAAFLAPEPTSPNRIVIVLVGVFFGLAMGAGLGIVLEAADTSVHTPRQLQSSLGLPVLVSIPQIWLESDRAKLRRQRLRTAAATLVLVVFALAGGAVNYWWVNVSDRSIANVAPVGAPEAAPDDPILDDEEG